MTDQPATPPLDVQRAQAVEAEVERLRYLLDVHEDQNAPLTVSAWKRYAQHWAERAEAAEATIARVDALHQPRWITQIRGCDAHRWPTSANTRASRDCPDCERGPVLACSDIRCCDWPCAEHLALHGETEDTCAHRAGQPGKPG